MDLRRRKILTLRKTDIKVRTIISSSRKLINQIIHNKVKKNLIWKQYRGKKKRVMKSTLFLIIWAILVENKGQYWSCLCVTMEEKSWLFQWALFNEQDLKKVTYLTPHHRHLLFKGELSKISVNLSQTEKEHYYKNQKALWKKHLKTNELNLVHEIITKHS